MASRHLSRSLALQTLFECDMNGALSASNIEKVLKRNAAEPVHKDADQVFSENLLKGVLAKLDEIDQVIVKAAPQWPLDKIAPIDRNVLRIGLYELLFSDRTAVPPKVALNEAIELAKSYGGDTSGKFVNGVLGTVYRNIGEPGKESRNADSIGEEHLGGILLTAVVDGVASVALVHDAFKRWTLPKAKCQKDETTADAANRALADELGVSASVGATLGENEYVAHEPGSGKVRRVVTYYLACVDEKKKLTCKICEGISEAKWFTEDELNSIEMYHDLKPVIASGLEEAKRACQ
jgi:transcription antitermination protein NusB